MAKQVQEKEDLLQRLSLGRMYRLKNKLSELELLTKKWRRCSQWLLPEQLCLRTRRDGNLGHYSRREENFTGFINFCLFFLRLFSLFLGWLYHTQGLKCALLLSYTPGPSVEYLSELQCEKRNVLKGRKM